MRTAAAYEIFPIVDNALPYIYNNDLYALSCDGITVQQIIWVQIKMERKTPPAGLHVLPCTNQCIPRSLIL